MRDLSAIEARALGVIVLHGEITCANLGDLLWHKGGRGNCSCPFARPAGLVIKRLRKLGLVDLFLRDGDPRTLYAANWKGKAIFAAYPTPEPPP